MELDQSDKEVNAQIHVRQCFSVNLMQNKNLVTFMKATRSCRLYYFENVFQPTTRKRGVTLLMCDL